MYIFCTRLWSDVCWPRSRTGSAYHPSSKTDRFRSCIRAPAPVPSFLSCIPMPFVHPPAILWISFHSLSLSFTLSFSISLVFLLCTSRPPFQLFALLLQTSGYLFFHLTNLLIQLQENKLGSGYLAKGAVTNIHIHQGQEPRPGGV
jgi:hypothetical protein